MFTYKPIIKTIKPIIIQVNEMDSKGIVAIKYPFKIPFIILKKNADATITIGIFFPLVLIFKG